MAPVLYLQTKSKQSSEQVGVCQASWDRPRPGTKDFLEASSGRMPPPSQAGDFLWAGAVGRTRLRVHGVLSQVSAGVAERVAGAGRRPGRAASTWASARPATRSQTRERPGGPGQRRRGEAAKLVGAGVGQGRPPGQPQRCRPGPQFVRAQPALQAENRRRSAEAGVASRIPQQQ